MRFRVQVTDGFGRAGCRDSRPLSKRTNVLNLLCFFLCHSEVVVQHKLVYLGFVTRAAALAHDLQRLYFKPTWLS